MWAHRISSSRLPVSISASARGPSRFFHTSSVYRNPFRFRIFWHEPDNKQSTSSSSSSHQHTDCFGNGANPFFGWSSPRCDHDHDHERDPSSHTTQDDASHQHQHQSRKQRRQQQRLHRWRQEQQHHHHHQQQQQHQEQHTYRQSRAQSDELAAEIRAAVMEAQEAVTTAAETIQQMANEYPSAFRFARNLYKQQQQQQQQQKQQKQKQGPDTQGSKQGHSLQHQQKQQQQPQPQQQRQQQQTATFSDLDADHFEAQAMSLAKQVIQKLEQEQHATTSAAQPPNRAAVAETSTPTSTSTSTPTTTPLPTSTSISTQAEKSSSSASSSFSPLPPPPPSSSSSSSSFLAVNRAVRAMTGGIRPPDHMIQHTHDKTVILPPPETSTSTPITSTSTPKTSTVTSFDMTEFLDTPVKPTVTTTATSTSTSASSSTPIPPKPTATPAPTSKPTATSTSKVTLTSTSTSTRVSPHDAAAQLVQALQASRLSQSLVNTWIMDVAHNRPLTGTNIPPCSDPMLQHSHLTSCYTWAESEQLATHSTHGILTFESSSWYTSIIYPLHHLLPSSSHDTQHIYIHIQSKQQHQQDMIMRINARQFRTSNDSSPIPSFEYVLTASSIPTSSFISIYLHHHTIMEWNSSTILDENVVKEMWTFVNRRGVDNRLSLLFTLHGMLCVQYHNIHDTHFNHLLSLKNELQKNNNNNDFIICLLNWIKQQQQHTQKMEQLIQFFTQ